METHGIHPGEGSQDLASIRVTCSDCGHVYLIAADQSSGTCSVCGNVAFLDSKRPLEALSEEIVARRVLPRLRENAPAPADPLAAFRSTPDGKDVEKIRVKYQVEWQLWAALARRFGDPAYHMAYVTTMLAENRLEQAAERYREHRSVMALLDDSRWQAEVADLQLARIESLSLARMPNARGDYSFDLPTFLKLLPFDSRLYKVAWIAFGLFLAAKFLHLAPIRP